MNGDNPAVGRYRALADRCALERATTEFKASPLFKSFSRRLLFDLVERSHVQVVDGVPAFPLDERPVEGGLVGGGPFLAIAVLDGALRATERGAGSNTAAILRPGVHLRDQSLAAFGLGQLRLEAHNHPAKVVAISAGDLIGSPAAAWSLDLSVVAEKVRKAETVEDIRCSELIWVSTSPDANVPVEAAMHILGAAIARYGVVPPNLDDGCLALYIFSKPPQFLVWNGTHFERRRRVPPLSGFLDMAGEHDRILFGHPEDPMHRPREADSLPINRIVHLTRQVPTDLPRPLRNILPPGLVKKDESIFSSYIASVLIDYDRTAAPCAALCQHGEFDARPLPCGAADEPAMRPYRDSCALRVEATRLRHAWDDWIGGPKGPEQCPPFIDVAADKHAMRLDTSKAWARAVTNRRVGIAISGGGASAYRIGPILKRLNTNDIPIDVVAALSGGALIGAFYCHSQLAGFERAKCLAPLFQLTLPQVVIWTRPPETVLDILFGGTRVEDLEMRFAAIAVALPDCTVPQATVVVKGTLGEAARVSGCLPPSFAPTTKKGIRYTDGGAGCLVPAQAARDCGADVVLACNVIPGPALGNPYAALPGYARLLRSTPILGRYVDSYTWYAFLLSQASREYGDHAEVYVPFRPQSFPLFESTAFIAAQCIIDDAESEGDELDKYVAKLKKAWLDLHSHPPSGRTPPSKRPPRRSPRRSARGGLRGKHTRAKSKGRK